MKKAGHHSFAAMKAEELRGGMRRKFIHGERLMLAEVRFKKGDVVPRHAHDNEQITQVISGEMHFWFGENDEQAVIVRAGEAVTIPSNLPHRADIMEDTVSFDVFNPPREDWITGEDKYLRG